MPFKSDKQRKWMHANEPEMAKKWEKEEALREKLRGIIKRELEATTTSAVPAQNTPQAFKKSTYKAIQVDDEDDEKNESTNEAISEAPMATRATLKRLNSELNKASDVIIKITDKYKKQGDIDGLVKIWMRGLHLRLKKSGIKMESVNEAEKKWTDYGNHFKQLSLGFKQVPFWKKLNKNQKEAISIALIMGGDMTGAVAEIEKIKTGLSKDKKVKNALRVANESINESDLGLTYKKGKTVKVTHKKSGKSLVIIDKPNVKKEYEKIGFYVESVNEKVAKPFSEHLRKAQDEIEYMISNGPTPDGDDGVYDRPNQAMKLLQIAQKSLGKIK